MDPIKKFLTDTIEAKNSIIDQVNKVEAGLVNSVPSLSSVGPSLPELPFPGLESFPKPTDILPNLGEMFPQPTGTGEDATETGQEVPKGAVPSKSGTAYGE